jgi:hypothetical protein
MSQYDFSQLSQACKYDPLGLSSMVIVVIPDVCNVIHEPLQIEYRSS